MTKELYFVVFLSCACILLWVNNYCTRFQNRRKTCTLRYVSFYINTKVWAQEKFKARQCVSHFLVKAILKYALLPVKLHLPSVRRENFYALIYSFIGVIELKIGAPQMAKAVCDSVTTFLWLVGPYNNHNCLIQTKLPYKMNIYMAFNSTTWLRNVQFIVLVISEFWFLNFTCIRYNLVISKNNIKRDMILSLAK